MSKEANQFSISRRIFVASGAGLILAGMTERAFAAFQDPAITFERVGFQVEGLPVNGVLVRQRTERSLGAVVTCGPWTCVKEQAPLAYAAAMARRGYAALAFDHRYFGASGGEPRQFESPTSKVADIRGAVDFLRADQRTRGLAIAAFGICAGGGYALRATADDRHIEAFVGVAATYNDAAETRQAWGAAYDRAATRGEAAQRKWVEQGVAEYIPAVGPAGMDVAMPNPEALAYYGMPRAGAIYDNRFAVQSFADCLPFDAFAAGAAMAKPVLVVHSDNALFPATARRFYEAASGKKRQLWLKSEGQVDFYDDPRLSEPAADAAAEALKSWLSA